jgi:hypothetical protein
LQNERQQQGRQCRPPQSLNEIAVSATTKYQRSDGDRKKQTESAKDKRVAGYGLLLLIAMSTASRRDAAILRPVRGM